MQMDVSIRRGQVIGGPSMWIMQRPPPESSISPRVDSTTAWWLKYTQIMVEGLFPHGEWSEGVFFHPSHNHRELTKCLQQRMWWSELEETAHQLSDILISN